MAGYDYPEHYDGGGPSSSYDTGFMNTVREWIIRARRRFRR